MTPMQPASDAQKIAMPSHTMGCRYQRSVFEAISGRFGPAFRI